MAAPRTGPFDGAIFDPAIFDTDTHYRSYQEEQAIVRRKRRGDKSRDYGFMHFTGKRR